MPQMLSQPFAQWLQEKGARPGQEIEVDAVVVGSGYGGAVAALRLAQEGRRVLVLERGAEFQPGDFPNDVSDLPKFVRAHGLNGTLGNVGGLFDFRVGVGMASLVANGLGGGSLINAGVMMRPDREVFAQPAWPAEIRHGLDDRACAADGTPLGLDAAFTRAQEMLDGELFDDGVHPARPPLPDLGPTAKSLPGASRLPKAQALRQMAEAMKKQLPRQAAGQHAPSAFEPQPARVTIGLKHCRRCGDCFTGCNVPQAKKTLLTNYLQHACNCGAELVTGAFVYSVAPHAHCSGQQWLLRVLPAEKERNALRLEDAMQREGYVLRAGLVVLAAGAYGSTELLLRSRNLVPSFCLSPALGTRLSGNGDSLTALADLEEPVEGVGHGARAGPLLDVGPTITTLLDLRDRPALQDRIVIQEGAVPGALAMLFRELLATTWTLRHLGTRGRTPRANHGLDPLAASGRLAQHSQILLAMGHDGSKGRLVWVPEMDGAAPFWPQPEQQDTYCRQQELFDAAEQGTGGVHLHPPTWRLVPPDLRRLADGATPPPAILSVHPLGGSPMGDHFEAGVVDHAGRVWSGPHTLWDNLLVLDGAIVPTSLGCNPLWTITALAERAMAQRRRARLPQSGAAAANRAAPQPGVASAMRTPRAPSSTASPPIAFDLLEKLEKRDLCVQGALREALRSSQADADIAITMPVADWLPLWEASDHRIDHIRGRLRLLADAGQGERVALAYEVVHDKSHIQLFNREPLPALFRLLRMPAVFLTWFMLRGLRDLAESRDRESLSACKGGGVSIRRGQMFALLWMATEVRHVRYDLELALAHSPAGSQAPQRLWLWGHKKISYGAPWSRILACLAPWLGQQVLPFLRTRLPRWLRPGRGETLTTREWIPLDLRRSLVQQLTEPEIRLHTQPLALGRHDRRKTMVAAARFAFDMQQPLQRTALSLQGGADTTTATVAALGYPALVLRHLLQSWLLDFRLPTYSNEPVRDDASPEDVDLRIAGGRRLAPQEFALPVPVGRSSSDDGTEQPHRSLLHLRLWRYARTDAHGNHVPPQWEEGSWCDLPVRRAKSVLLMHAFDMSGYLFTFKSTARNFAEHLYDEGWEVWILDSRMSSRTAAAAEPCTVDQLGFLDVPCAVEFMLATLRRELPPHPDPLQVHAFGHCMGASALLIALLSGKLSYGHPAPRRYASTTGEVPLLPKLAALVTSQMHPLMVGSRTAQSKMRIPGLLRDYAGHTMIQLGVRGPVTAVFEAMADRLLAGFPVPDGEHCHGEGALHRFDEDCATCRRIRFLLGGIFRHANLDTKTHKLLPKFFGAGSVRLFAQGAKILRYERLCSEDGQDVYATDAAIGRHMALPVRFVHGECNDLFDRESATRSATKYGQVHPGWAQAYGMAGKSGEREVCDVIADYGHVDVLIGDKVMLREGGGASVYDRLSTLLETAWQTRSAQPVLPAPGGVPAPALMVSFPRSGPFLGPVTESGGRRWIGISFVIDDREGGEPHGAAALVRHLPAGTTVVPLQMRSIKVAVPARDDRFDLPCRGALTGLRVAEGKIEITGCTDVRALRIRCVSYLFAPSAPLPPVRAWLGLPRSAPVTPVELKAAIRQQIIAARKLRKEAGVPFPATLSEYRRHPAHHLTMRATVPVQVCAESQATDPVCIAVGCCRYPGASFDRRRGDQALQEVAWLARSKLRALRPELLFMLGDQIYADRTAGLVDELSPIERFFARHQEAFTTAGARKLFSSLPTICLPDDHEFTDGFPLGRPLLRRAVERTRADKREADQRERAAYRVAVEAVRAYQLGQLPDSAWRDGYCELRRGAVRFFVLDTRTHRRRMGGSVQTMTPAARRAFARWVRSMAPDELACLATGSVVLPGLYQGADPANMGPPDTMQAAPADRGWLLEQLVAHVPRRFVLLSGDYHLSFAGEVTLDGQRVGAAIVAPPFYAPLTYANARPEDVWLDEAVSTAAGTVSVHALDAQHLPMTGSGFATVEFKREMGAWRVRFRTRLTDPAQYEGRWFALEWPVITL